MSFLYPIFLAGALAIAIPIALHLLRRDVAPEVPFTAVRLLRRSPLEQTRRRRLRDLLLLAGPRRGAAAARGGVRPAVSVASAAGAPSLRIVAIDRSFSMGAPGRFQQAQALAREAVAAAGSGQQRRGDRLRRSRRRSSRRRAVPARRAPPSTRCASATARPASGRCSRACRSWRRQPPARLVIVSDLQRAGWERRGAGHGAVIAARRGSPGRRAGAANLAVTRLRRDGDSVRRGRSGNGGAAAVSGTARSSVDIARPRSAPFAVPAASSVDVTVPLSGAGPRHPVGRDRRADGLPVDNRRFLLLDPTGRPQRVDRRRRGEPVGVLRRSRAAVRRRRDRLRRADGVRGRARHRRPEQLAQQSVLMLLSTRNLDRRGRERLVTFVRQGGGLLIAASADVDPSAVVATMSLARTSRRSNRPAGGAVLAATDLRHPIFRPFGALAANLGQVRFARTWKVRPDGWDVAARFTNGSPALLERREGKWPGGAVHVGRRSAVERLSAEPGVRAVRDRGGAPRGGADRIAGRVCGRGCAVGWTAGAGRADAWRRTADHRQCRSPRERDRVADAGRVQGRARGRVRSGRGIAGAAAGTPGAAGRRHAEPLALWTVADAGGARRRIDGRTT